MTIERSETGPVFRVTDEESGETFVGTSPTKPCTAVCVLKNLKTRIRCVLYKRTVFHPYCSSVSTFDRIVFQLTDDQFLY